MAPVTFTLVLSQSFGKDRKENQCCCGDSVGNKLERTKRRNERGEKCPSMARHQFRSLFILFIYWPIIKREGSKMLEGTSALL